MTNKEIECLTKIEASIDTQKQSVKKYKDCGRHETAELMEFYILGLEVAVTIMRKMLD